MKRAEPLPDVTTTIPAQPGFRLAGFCYDDPLPEDPATLESWSTPIVAWLVITSFPHQEPGSRTWPSASVIPVATSGSMDQDDVFVVDPDGTWRAFDRALDDERDAAVHWLAERRLGR